MVFPAALEATALLLATIYLILWYKVSLVTTGLHLLLGCCCEVYPIFEGTLLASVFTVILARVLVPSLELGGDDIHTDELLPPFIGVFSEALVVCHTAAGRTCELVDNDIDHCPVLYFGIRIQSINLIEVVLASSSLPKFVYIQVCSIGAVMVSII